MAENPKPRKNKTAAAKPAHKAKNKTAAAEPARIVQIYKRLRNIISAWARDGLAELSERLAALILLVLVSSFAGYSLGNSTDRLAELPGLLLMVPAAIALRGNIFGAVGARLGTSIHAGTFRMSLKPSSVVGENMIAGLVMTVATSVSLAVLAKGAAIVFGISGSISLSDFIVVSALGGLLASLVVAATVLALTAGAARFGWDPDNVTAPMVTAAGDMATIPSLVLAAGLAGSVSARYIAIVATLLALVGVVAALKYGRESLGMIIKESMPVLFIGIVLDLLAGATVERQLASFSRYPVLLVALPAFLALAGALGGTLSSRLSSQFHLGTVASTVIPDARARTELATTTLLALPIFGLCAIAAELIAKLSSLASPGLAAMAAMLILAGVAATILAVTIAYYATLFAVRFGLDPDSYGIPLVSSSLDLFGAFSLILVVSAFGYI